MKDDGMPSDHEPLTTPDGRYIVVRGRLWRKSNPAIAPDERQCLVDALMDARRDVRDNEGDVEAIRKARTQVDNAKTALGERGPIWWADGKPDLTRRMVANTEYAEWFSVIVVARQAE